MTSIRSHFSPDNIEGIRMGDEVYFHVTNLGTRLGCAAWICSKRCLLNAELLIMPGETQTLKWIPD
jgi:nitrous-oxide reductase